MLARVTQAEQLAAQAAQWQAAGRPDMAVQLYTAALDQDPSKFAIRMQLAECLAYLQQPEPAAEHYLMVAQAYAARGTPRSVWRSASASSTSRRSRSCTCRWVR